MWSATRSRCPRTVRSTSATFRYSRQRALEVTTVSSITSRSSPRNHAPVGAGESHLGTLEELAREPAGEDIAKQALSLEPALLEAYWQPRRPLHKSIVEERGTRLEGARHGRDVHLCQEIVRKVVRNVHGERTIEGVARDTVRRLEVDPREREDMTSQLGLGQVAGPVRDALGRRELQRSEQPVSLVSSRRFVAAGASYSQARAYHGPAELGGNPVE
jgi:hypothetical protein